MIPYIFTEELSLSLIIQMLQTRLSSIIFFFGKDYRPLLVAEDEKTLAIKCLTETGCLLSLMGIYIMLGKAFPP